MAAPTSETVLRFLVLVVFVVVSSVTVIYLTLHHATADEVYDFVILGGETLSLPALTATPSPTANPSPTPTSGSTPTPAPTLARRLNRQRGCGPAG